MEDNFKSIGFPYPQHLIFSFVGGSQLHGAKLEGTDDTDWYGIFVEPAEKILGIDAFGHFVHSTASNERRNGPDDVDVTLYSLNKWARLACKGNPSIIHFLFAKPEFQTLEWCCLTQDEKPFLAKSHLSAYFGYANAQLQRLYNGRGPKDVSRPFLEAQFGYDTKYAMHVIRLLDEAKELMETGKITLPRPNAEFLKDIRAGKVKLYDIEKLADELMREARDAQAKSPLPDTPDRKEISRRLAITYQDVWYRLFKNRSQAATGGTNG